MWEKGIFGFKYKVTLTAKEQKYVKPHLEYITQETFNLEDNEIGFGRHFLTVLKMKQESESFTISTSINDGKLKIAKYIDFDSVMGEVDLF